MTIGELRLFLLDNLGLFPYLLVYLVGLLISISRWRLHSKVSILSSIAFLLFLIQWLIHMTISYMFHKAIAQPEAMSSVAFYSGFASVVTAVISTAAWLLLIISNFFIGRNAQIALDTPNHSIHRTPALRANAGDFES